MMSTPDDGDIAGVRHDVRAWLAANWDPELSLREWRIRLVDSGWARPDWPAEWYGRSLSAAAADVVAEEIARLGAVPAAAGMGTNLAAPTLLAHGSDGLKRRFIRPTLTGEVTWCQLFSEPGAGSDLAGLTTRAERAGDHWMVNGQKVWTTSAGHADFGLLLARTAWDVPKHCGITYFVVPMDQPGVEVRPLRQMNGHASFNEVFLSDVEVPAGNVVGEVDGGWPVALTTLSHERRLAVIRKGSEPAGSGRTQHEAAMERARALEPYVWYPQRAGRPDLVVEHAIATGRAADPLVRQEIVKLISLAWSARWTGRRAAAARALGRPPGPEGSLGKLYGSSIARMSAGVHALIADASGMLAEAETPLAGTIAEIILSVPAASIAGGTDEIQRNIIGERILGLPKEPDADRNAPFRDVPKASPAV